MPYLVLGTWGFAHCLLLIVFSIWRRLVLKKTFVVENWICSSAPAPAPATFDWNKNQHTHAHTKNKKIMRLNDALINFKWIQTTAVAAVICASSIETWNTERLWMKRMIHNNIINVWCLYLHRIVIISLSLFYYWAWLWNSAPHPP